MSIVIANRLLDKNGAPVIDGDAPLPWTVILDPAADGGEVLNKIHSKACNENGDGSISVDYTNSS